MRKHATGAGAGGFAGVPNESAVHEYLFDAGGKRGRIRERRAIDHRVRIKEDQVGEGAFANESAIGPAESMRGKRSHFANCFRQSQPMFFADIKTEDSRKRSRAAGMVRVEAAVTRDHNPGLLVESFDIAFDHGLADDAR